MRKKNKAELEAEVSIHRVEVITLAIVKIARHVGLYGSVMFIANEAAKVLIAFSGKVTSADIKFDLPFLAGSSCEKIIAISLFVSMSCFVYARAVERKRKIDIERLTQRIKELEMGCDPRRSSSNLTPKGETRPEERL